MQVNKNRLDKKLYAELKQTTTVLEMPVNKNRLVEKLYTKLKQTARGVSKQKQTG